MEKIKSLTAAQGLHLVNYRDEWLQHGRSTYPSNRKQTEDSISFFFEKLDLQRPYFWWCDGPAVGSMVRTLLRDNLRANLGANLGDNLRANLRANLRDNLRANLRANLGDNLGDNLRANLGDNLRDNLWANLEWNFYGQHESAWPAFYLWPHTQLRPMYDANSFDLLVHWVELSKSTGWWHPHKGIVFCCERPRMQIVNPQGRLHKDEGPALLCRDGWPVYALNGVRMIEEYVMTPAEQLRPETVMAETNVDVRRELIRKVGVERMLSKMPHKQLEKRANYELISVRLSDQVRDARYLKMLNPSIGVFHLEGVSPECDTIEKSLNWRNSQWFENAETLT